tara:strand:- start:15753 stop:16829 length:1077 start_codon:yes stop_codon:yes gene_type:complete
MFADEKYKKMVKNVLVAQKPKTFPEINIENLISEKFVSPGLTKDESFKDLMIARQEMWISILEKHLGESVLFLDSDTIILKDFYKDLEDRLLVDDILHQGGGIVAFNSNKKTIELWKSFVKSLKEIPKEKRKTGFPEPEFIDLIDSYKSSSRLPKEYGFLSKDCCIYHAMNGGVTIAEKICSIFVAKKIIENLNNKDKKIQYKIPDVEDFIESQEPLICSEGLYLVRKRQLYENEREYINSVHTSFLQRIEFNSIEETKELINDCAVIFNHKNLLELKKYACGDDFKNFEMYYSFSNNWQKGKNCRNIVYINLENSNKFLVIKHQKYLDENGNVVEMFDENNKFLGIASKVKPIAYKL